MKNFIKKAQQIAGYIGPNMTSDVNVLVNWRNIMLFSAVLTAAALLLFYIYSLVRICNPCVIEFARIANPRTQNTFV